MGSRHISKDGEVSQEGFFSSVGKVLAAVGNSYVRSTVIGSVPFYGTMRPEVNGVPAKNWQHMIVMANTAINNGTAWDMTLFTLEHNSEESPTGASFDTVVIIGFGREARVRLPGYDNNSYAAEVASMIINDLKLKRVE